MRKINVFVTTLFFADNDGEISEQDFMFNNGNEAWRFGADTKSFDGKIVCGFEVRKGN